ARTSRQVSSFPAGPPVTSSTSTGPAAEVLRATVPTSCPAPVRSGACHVGVGLAAGTGSSFGHPSTAPPPSTRPTTSAAATRNHGSQRRSGGRCPSGNGAGPPAPPASFAVPGARPAGGLADPSVAI